MKSLSIEWAASIVSNIKVYWQEDPEIKLFGKLLKNEFEEDFWFVLTWVWESVTKSLKGLFWEKNIHIKEQDLAKEIEDLELIEESMWWTILWDMYDEQDIHKIEQMITLKHNLRKQKL